MIKDEVVLHTVSKTEHKGGNENHSNKNSIFFSTVDGLDNLFEVEISAGKRIKISFEAWDKNSGSDDLETTWTDLEVPFSETGASSDWSMKSYTKNRGTDGKATFTFKYRVTSCDTFFTGRGCNSCVSNRYGEDCSIVCELSPGFYTCSSKGEKICEERRKGEDCTLCYEQFTGESCENCAKDYYPEDTCAVHCPPAPNRYICTDQGQKQCLQNRTGSDCEECISNHYGEDCSTFCEETDNYTCDKSGGKICKEHFYPAEKCDINCESVLGNFTCDLTTGKKICVDGKAGRNCDVCENRNRVGQNCEKCKKFFYGPDCTIHCEPEVGLNTCMENGTKLCQEKSANAEENCRPKTLNIAVIVGAGAGGFLLILILTAVLFKVRRGRSEDEAEEAATRTDSEDIYDRIQASEQVEESGKGVCVSNMNIKGTNCEEIDAENSKVTLNNVEVGAHATYVNTESVKKEDMYVEAFVVVERNKDSETYVNTESFKKEDMYVEASASRRKYDFGTYVYSDRVKQQNNDMYVEASIVGRKEDSKTYVNTELAEKEYMYVKASVLGRNEDSKTYVNTELAEKEDMYVKASVLGRNEDSKTYVNTELAEKEDMYVKASVLGRNEDSKTYVDTELAEKEDMCVKHLSSEEKKILRRM